MLSHNAKEWERLASTADANKKKVRRAKFETKIVSTSKKIKKQTLKELFSKGSSKFIKMNINKRLELFVK